jgi:alpha-beta hydrolase superfamily lysophospholipase
MMFGGYNKRIEHVRTKSDWLTRDETIVDAYEADPDCGFVTSAGLLRDMLVGLKFIHNKNNLRQMERTLPVLFLSGEEDPVGGYGAGVRAAAEAFQKAGVHKVSLRLYSQGRHEMLNELNRDEVYGDILGWIEGL